MPGDSRFLRPVKKCLDVKSLVLLSVIANELKQETEHKNEWRRSMVSKSGDVDSQPAVVLDRAIVTVCRQ